MRTQNHFFEKKVVEFFTKFLLRADLCSDCWENDHGLKDFLLFPLEIVCRPAVDGISTSHLTKSWNRNVGDRPYKANTERETAARRSAGEASQVCSFEEPTTNVMMPAHNIQYTISAW